MEFEEQSTSSPDFVEMIRAEVVLGGGEGHKLFAKPWFHASKTCTTDFLYNFGTIPFDKYSRNRRISFDVVEDRRGRSKIFAWSSRGFSRFHDITKAFRRLNRALKTSAREILPFSPPTLRDPGFFHLGNCCICNYTWNTHSRMRGKFKSSAVLLRNSSETGLDFLREKNLFWLKLDELITRWYLIFRNKDGQKYRSIFIIHRLRNYKLINNWVNN